MGGGDVCRSRGTAKICVIHQLGHAECCSKWEQFDCHQAFLTGPRSSPATSRRVEEFRVLSIASPEDAAAAAAAAAAAVAAAPVAAAVAADQVAVG